MRSRTGTRTSEDHGFREFLDEDDQESWSKTRGRTGRGRGRGRPSSEIFKNVSDEDGHDEERDGNEDGTGTRARTVRTSTSCGGLVSVF